MLTSTFFFLYVSADQRDLHSFPTRRSSDLFSGQNGTMPSWATRNAATHIASTCAREPRKSGGRSPTDRKSTRLNSSHLGISYAVFCLKKKNKQTKRVQDRHKNNCRSSRHHQ